MLQQPDPSNRKYEEKRSENWVLNLVPLQELEEWWEEKTQFLEVSKSEDKLPLIWSL